MTDESTEIRVGERPPKFSLPQIGTDRSCCLEDFGGRPTVLFMWASW